MGRASPEYCKKTPISKMGFTQKSSCKAQGLIPRTSKENKGKLVKSPKYKSVRRTYRQNSTLYSPGKKKPQTKTGFKDRETAERTLKNISKKPMEYQLQVVNTMYNRAKYHPYQTKNMRDAMKVYREWLKLN